MQPADHAGQPQDAAAAAAAADSEVQSDQLDLNSTWAANQAVTRDLQFQCHSR